MHATRHMITTLAICFLTAQAGAHELELGKPWCQTIDGPGNPNAPVGKFPGPPKHKLMQNVALQEFDISSLIPSLAGRSVRMRFWLMGPGGVIAEHCHENRPALVYLISGTVRETKCIYSKNRENGDVKKTDCTNDDNVVVKTLSGPLALDEGNGTHHWWRNESNKAVLMVVLDVPPHRAPSDISSDGKVPTRDSGLLKDEILRTMPFAKEYPLIPDVADYQLQARRVTLAHRGELGARDHSSEPTLYYVLEGTLLEYRSDTQQPIVRPTGSTSSAARVKNFWRNISGEEATLLIFDINKKR